MSRYTDAVEWIALNDEPTIEDPSVIFGFVTVGLIADVFGKDQMTVAEDVAKVRQLELAKEA